MIHQYLVRETGAVATEQLIADRFVRFAYNRLREQAPALFRALTGPRVSSLLGFWHYDLDLPLPGRRGRQLLTRMGVDPGECLDPPEHFTTARQVFERRIRYQELRPMDPDPRAVVSPADSRMVFGSLSGTPALFVKDKFFSMPALLGERTVWPAVFADGDFAVFRLTPDKYHYNHVPVTGLVVDIYEIEGAFHSCNPGALVALAGLHARNRRVVTILDTDVAGGARIGLVAMVETAALMIGEIVQCYSAENYAAPRPVVRGMRLERGCPKSLYRPGSSTDILLFEKNAVVFAEDLRRNQARRDVASRFSAGFGAPLVETDLRVRSTIARPRIPIAFTLPASTLCPNRTP